MINNRTTKSRKNQNARRNRNLGGKVFTNGPGDLGSIPCRVILKTLKMVLDTSLLNTQQYKLRIKSKVEQHWERSCALPYIAIEKGAFWSSSTTVADLQIFWNIESKRHQTSGDEKKKHTTGERENKFVWFGLVLWHINYSKPNSVDKTSCKEETSGRFHS